MSRKGGPAETVPFTPCSIACLVIVWVIAQVQELKQAKKMLGKQWFKQAAALRNSQDNPAKAAAEKVRISSTGPDDMPTVVTNFLLTTPYSCTFIQHRTYNKETY